jgi:hypothetical protein
MTAQDAIHALWTASIATPIDVKTNGARDIAVALNLLLAGIFALYRPPYSYNSHGNISVAINPGPRRTNNQGD